MEERFCSKVKELGCTCVTISHRPALVAFHDLVLALDGEGGWSIHEVCYLQDSKQCDFVYLGDLEAQDLLLALHSTASHSVHDTVSDIKFA